MTAGGRRFDASELRTPGMPSEAYVTDAELAEALAMARELESLTAADVSGPTMGYGDRVMAAIRLEPPPRLVVRPASTVRGGSIGAALLAFRHAWAVAFTGGRPFAVRAQAFAVVAVVVLAAGLLTTATAVTVGGLLQGRSSPPPSVVPAPTEPPSVAPTIAPSPTPSNEPTASPAATPAPTGTAEPTATPGSGNTARPTSPNSGPGGGGGGGPTAEPGHTAQPTDDHGGGGGGGGGGPGPDGTDDHSGGGSGSGGGGGSGPG
jgi:hypothetical protein